MSRPKYFIKTEVFVYGGRTKYEVVKGFSDADSIANVGSERDATKLCEEFERLTDEIAHLKAEVMHLTSERDGFYNMNEGNLKECCRLKAEVENTNRINTELLVLSNQQASVIRNLTNAGDAMAEMLTPNEEWREQSADPHLYDDEYRLIMWWKAAKEVKNT